MEQQKHWQPGRSAPGYVEQCRQLTEARAEYAWLRAGSQTAQQQALRDFAQAMGFTWENDLQFALKRAKAGELMLGGAAEHRAMIAEEFNAADF